ncbi:MAG: peptidoglycan binding protein CsiV [Gammaproteobacteria bacterium]|nr:peptidoglycan binding protein CsiV [Gammaproteobacteria bacterium]
MRKNVPFIAILLMSMLVPQAHSVRADPSLTPWYTVELILFTRNRSPGASGEIWPQSAEQLDWDSARSGNYALVSTGSWQLNGAELALKKSHRDLTPVIHTAWRQPVFSRNSASAFYLRSDREVTPGTPLVEGMVKVSISRYLHVDLDLLLRETPAGAVRLPGGFQTFRFNEHRRMRSGELHYIDHPLMGMLILITPVKSMESQSSEESELQESESQTVTEEPVRRE